MEKINVVVIEYSAGHTYEVFLKDEWDILSPFNIKGRLVAEYTIKNNQIKELKDCLIKMSNIANGSSSMIHEDVKKIFDKFKKIIQPEEQQENNKQPKGIMAAYCMSKLNEYK